MTEDERKSKPLYPPLLCEDNFPQFRHLKENLALHGVKPRRLGRKDYLVTHEVLAALEQLDVTGASDEKTSTTPIITPADPVAYARALLGKKLKAGGR